MTIKLNFKFIVSFLALTFLMHEAHEIAHTSLGRLICGCWGERDFNIWKTCSDCAKTNPWELWSTFAGPCFTFIVIWIGALLLKTQNTNAQKSLGLALIFSNMPFARLLNPALGGGDEVMLINYFTGNWNLARLLVLIILLLILIYPLYKAFITIHNKYRIGLFILFFLAPIVMDLLVVLGIMNTLLNAGVLSNYWILGSPILVSVWTLFVFVLFLVTRKSIYTLGSTNNFRT